MGKKQHKEGYEYIKGSQPWWARAVGVRSLAEEREERVQPPAATDAQSTESPQKEEYKSPGSGWSLFGRGRKKNQSDTTSRPEVPSGQLEKMEGRRELTPEEKRWVRDFTQVDCEDLGYEEMIALRRAGYNNVGLRTEPTNRRDETHAVGVAGDTEGYIYKPRLGPTDVQGWNVILYYDVDRIGPAGSFFEEEERFDKEKKAVPYSIEKGFYSAGFSDLRRKGWNIAIVIRGEPQTDDREWTW